MHNILAALVGSAVDNFKVAINSVGFILNLYLHC